MNWKRVFIGGLAAGLLINVIDLVVGAFVLEPRYKALQALGVFLAEPRLPFMPLWILGQLAIGLILAYLYAATRTTLGPGPRTAAVVGLLAGLLTHVPYNVVAASWYPSGRYIPLVTMLAGLVELVLGAMVAGCLYRDTET